MADKNQKVSEQAKSAEEARRIEEAERIAAEKEIMEKFNSERRLSTHRAQGLSSANSSVHDSESEAEKKRKERSPEDKEKDKRRTKSRKTNDGDEEEEENEDENVDDPLVNLGSVLAKMKGWFRQPTIMKMVTKPQTEKFHRYLQKFQEELMRAREERARLETQIEERAELVKIVREEICKGTASEVPKRPTEYAAAVARNATQVPKVTGVKGPVLPPPKLVTVRHESKESEEVKTMNE